MAHAVRLGCRRQILWGVDWAELRMTTATTRGIYNLFRAMSSGCHKFAPEERPDRPRAKSAVGRIMQYFRDANIGWGDNRETIAPCVFLTNPP